MTLPVAKLQVGDMGHPPPSNSVGAEITKTSPVTLPVTFRVRTVPGNDGNVLQSTRKDRVA